MGSLNRDQEALKNLPGLFQRDEDGYSHEYHFSERKHSSQVLKELNIQRENGALCDVTLLVGGQEFHCHRSVLAACSPYFLAMFTGEMRESSEARVQIKGISPSIMQQLIEFAYTAGVNINAENAQSLLSAANLVQIQSIQEACCEFLEQEMDSSNCLGIHCFAEAYVCSPLKERAWEFTLMNFSEVVRHDEVILLSKDKLIEILCSDDLNVETEEVVLQAVIGWVKYDQDQRRQDLCEVLKHVRLPFIDPYFLYDKTETEPVLTDLPDCRRLIDNAKRYIALKDRQVEFIGCQTEPRRSWNISAKLITIGGEIYSKNYLTSVDCYEMKENKWTRLRELPYARCHHGAAVSNGQTIYITGGFDKDKVVQTNVLRYEPYLDKWTKVQCMNTPRARHGMAVLDGYIYAVGGYDGQSRIDTVERYSPVFNKWTFVSNMTMPLSRCQATSLKGCLYVSGGTTEPNNQCVDLMQCYDPRTDAWTVLAPLPSPRCLGGLVALDSYIYAVGGTQEMVNASRSLSRYDPQTNRWIELAEMIEARFDSGVAVLNNRIYVMSGHDGENSFFHSIEEYDIDEDKWSIMSSTVMPYGRCRFGCIALKLQEFS